MAYKAVMRAIGGRCDASGPSTHGCVRIVSSGLGAARVHAMVAVSRGGRLNRVALARRLASSRVG
eukprot:12384644-Alexandrium_andersonii.AAC.1